MDKGKIETVSQKHSGALSVDSFITADWLAWVGKRIGKAKCSVLSAPEYEKAMTAEITSYAASVSLTLSFILPM